ncbi:MAG TPA: outer membrane beta-barrel protein [Pyrinomonadaceae bacterium]|nr:outer membrane beta-barrel protein [Pyrinomonadaceae bacterium]
MNRNLVFGIALIVSSIFAAAGPARAQEKDAPKLEIGPLFTSLSTNQPEFGGTEPQSGFGGRITYNLTDNFAVEAEGNFFPGKSAVTLSTGGRAVQGQFGVKAGKRFQRFGVFAKARPGFVSYDNVFTYTGVVLEGSGPFEFPRGIGETGRKTHFSTDVGSVLEFYPSRKIVTRFDVGDTIIRYGERKDIPRTFVPGTTPALVTLPSKVQHNFQFSASVGFRFMDGDDGADDAGAANDKSTPRFEIGTQFTSLSLRPPSRVFGSFFFGDAGVEHKPGVGARLTYNLNDNFALEGEGNFFTIRDFSNTATGGYPFQGQFGVKVGKRFERFGVFAKARPGFVGFTDVGEFIGTTTTTVDGVQFVNPQYRFGSRTYFSTDVGGVLEFYPSRRLVTRFDFGDTIIRYGRRQDAIFFLSPQLIETPATTRHNFQFSAGFGLRF